MVLAELTERFGGDAVFICRRSKSADDVLEYLRSPERDIVSEYVPFDSGQWVPLLALAKSALIDRRSALSELS